MLVPAHSESFRSIVLECILQASLFPAEGLWTFCLPDPPFLPPCHGNNVPHLVGAVIATMNILEQNRHLKYNSNLLILIGVFL